MVASAELNAAQAAKYTAEAQMIAARQAIVTANQDEKVRIDLEIRRANLRNAQAQADQADATARAAAIIARSAEREEAEKLADWRYQHIHMVYGGITEVTVRLAIAQLNAMAHIDPKCDIEIVFNSHGGDAFWGMTLFDFISQLRSKGHKITTVGLGSAMSMAAILLQAGDVRVMGNQAWLLIHKVKSTAIGNPEEIEDIAKWAEKMCERVKAIFVSRANKKITAEKFEDSWTRKDWTLYADEALALGFIDEIRGMP
jgi:ATP-dependent Clp endopeptidase proteolytic subunit ClpP